MRITLDTNILVRLAIHDDARQLDAARALLGRAELIAVPLAALCEFAWVLDRTFGATRAEIAASIRALLNNPLVVADRGAALDGCRLLDAGGDFADGAIAANGRALGGGTFITFDRQAIRLLTAQGHAAGAPD